MYKAFILRSLSVVCAFLIVACDSGVKIKGNVTEAEGELLSLKLNSNLIDTVRLTSNGDFKFKYSPKGNLPTFLTLSTENKVLATLLVEKNEKVIFNTDYNHPSSYSVSGSPGSILVKELNDKMAATVKSYDSLLYILKQSENSSNYDEITAKVSTDIGRLFTKYKQYLIHFIIKNSKSYAAYMAMYQKMPNGFIMFGKNQDAVYFKTLADSLEKAYPKSPYVEVLRDDYEKLIKAITLQQLFENAEEVEGLPDLKMEDRDGVVHTLKELKGKIVLLNFWASWNKGSTMDNMELMDIYNKYHSKGFEIYNVSLDFSSENWLTVLNNQNMPWINVCDFQGEKSYAARLYNISKLPTNFLLDKSGSLIAKDKYGKELEQLLQARLK